MNNTSKAIVIGNSEHQRLAALYKMLLPYGSKLTDDNALALAIYSKMHDLDPFNGECYFLVREKKNDHGEIIKREELGCYPGIKGKRKHAKRQLGSVRPEFAHFKVDYAIMGKEQIQQLGIDLNETAIVMRAELRDPISQGQYIMDTIKLAQAGYSKEEVNTMLGKPPSWVGYGVVTKRESNYLQQEPVKVARKRAESDAINQRFDLAIPDGLAEELAPELTDVSDGDSEETTPGQFTDVPTDKAPEPIIDVPFDAPQPEKQKRTEAEIQRELGFG